MASELTPILQALLSHRSLTVDESRQAFECMMGGSASEAEMGALLGVLATRVPTSDELLGAARVMRRHVTPVPCQTPAADLLDTAGTGGAPKTFNVSTAAALIAAGAGVKVAKHGNRSRTGRGSAEVLKALGVNVDATRDVQGRCIDDVGVCFCFAIHHHPAIKNVMPVRMALSVPTIFNLLGPLTNPLGAKRQMLGVYDGRFLLPMAHALSALGADRAIVLHSDDGLDEVSISAPTELAHLTEKGVHTERISPEDFGLERAQRETVVARDLEHAAQMVRDVLSGTDKGPARDMCVMSAGVALLAAGRVADVAEGIKLAQTTVDSGAAGAKLKALAEASAS